MPRMPAKSNSRHNRKLEFPLTESSGFLVRDANRAFQRLLERRIAAHGLKRGQWYFLRVLWAEDGLSQRELSARVGTMEPTTVIALRSMEKSGLIRRERSTDDKRKAQVWLTPKAQRLRADLLAVAREHHRPGGRERLGQRSGCLPPGHRPHDRQPRPHRGLARRNLDELRDLRFGQRRRNELQVDRLRHDEVETDNLVG